MLCPINRLTGLTLSKFKGKTIVVIGSCKPVHNNDTT